MSISTVYPEVTRRTMVRCASTCNVLSTEGEDDGTSLMIFNARLVRDGPSQAQAGHVRATHKGLVTGTMIVVDDCTCSH